MAELCESHTYCMDGMRFVRCEIQEELKPQCAVCQRWQKSTFQAQNANTLRRSTASLVGNNVSTGTFTRNVAVRVVKKSKWIKLKLAGGKFEGIERGDG
jgi:hypothetical protein